MKPLGREHFAGIPPTEQNQVRYIKKVKPPPAAFLTREWGGRFAALTPALGTPVNVVTLARARLNIPPQAIGVQLWRVNDPAGASGNADVRAVVTYSAGESRVLTFRCDWGGALLLYANEIAIDVESFNPDLSLAFAPFAVDVAATLALEPPRGSAKAPTYTVAPTRVVDAATRSIDVPALAQRVGLIIKYGEPVGSPADAPLGQIFITFMNRRGTALGWIDSQNARDALFGDGVPIPAGAGQIVLSNRSGYYVDLGALFHLGI